MGAKNIEDAIKIGRGSLLCNRVMRRGHQLWPAAYECTLAPYSWTFEGNYTIGYIPAAGGWAQPSAQWVLTINDPATHQTIATQTVTLSSIPTIEEYINGQWVAAQHFSFTDGKWVAENRGTNGYGSEGENTPQSAPARQSRMTATVNSTYNNVSISATYVGIMTQNGNNAVAGTGHYGIPVVTLGRYSSTNDKAPASEVTTTMTATVSFITPYTFVDAETGAVNSMTYDKIQPNAAYTDDFSFSVPSWVTVGTLSSLGTTITIHSRGTDFDVMFRYDRIRATLIGSSPSLYGDVYVYQSANIYTNEVKQYTGASTSISPDPIAATDQSFTVFGYLDYRYMHEYSSGEWDPDWLTSYESATAAIDSVSRDGIPVYDVTIVGDEVRIPVNETSYQLEYETESHIIDPNGRTWSQLIASATQEASQAYTYENPTVTISYEEIGPAAHTAHPTITVTQRVFIGLDLYDTLEGLINDGSTGGTLYGEYLTSSFSINSFTGSAVSGTGAAFNSTNGNVTTASRGTTEDPDPRNVATNVSVTVEANSMSGTSSAVTVTQAANNKTYVDPVASAVRIVSLSTYDIDGTCLDTAVTASVRATWVGDGYVYDAYENGTGDLNARTGFVPHSDEFVTGDDGVTMRVNGTDDYSNSTNQFYVENKYNTSQATHSVVAMFWGATSSAAYVTQAADELSDWILGNYVVSVAIGSNTVSASGGQATIVASGSHDRYRTWEDGTIQSSSSVPDTPTLSLVDISEEGVFWIDSTTLKHRNMAEYGTTDYVTIRATNGNVTADSNTVSATNTCTYGNVTFNDPGSTADPGGDSINLNPTCPFTWTSGSSGTMMGDGFDFEYVVMANDTYRTYGFTGHYADFGSLGTNTRSLGNTTIRAILKVDSSKTATAIIQEEANGPTSNHELTINWSNPVIIPGYGGSVNVGIVTAKYKTQYDSGDWDNGESITPAQVAASIQISGSGFTKSYTSGNSYVTISAPANSDYASSRDCTVTAYYGGKSDSTTVTQKNRPYRKELKTASGYRNMWLYNTDTESHDYTFTLEKTENGVHTSTPGQVAAGLAAGTGRIVAGVSSSPSSNDVDIDVTYVDNHEVITS